MDRQLKLTKPTPEYTIQQLEAIEDQQIQLDKLVEYYKSGIKIFKLSGVAGCGKTYLTVEFVKIITNLILQHTGQSPIISGATLAHSAKNVLANRFIDEDLNIKFYTIASLLKLVRFINNLGEITFIPSYQKRGEKKIRERPPIYHSDLVIIDECSQVSKETLDMLLEEKGDDTIILFLGDFHQTPPPSDTREVNSVSPTFNFQGANLHIPFRYEGDLQRLATAIAEEIDKEDGPKTFKFLTDFANEKKVDFRFTRNATNFYNSFMHSYLRDEDKIQGTILVSYRNTVTTAISKSLRSKILEEQDIVAPDKFIVGERLVCKRGAKEIEGTNAATLTKHKVLLITKVSKSHASVKSMPNNPEEYLSISITDGFIEGFNTTSTFTKIPIYLLNLVDENGSTFNNVPVLQDDLNRVYLQWKLKLKSAADRGEKATYWAKYYSYLEFFNQFNFGYAVNTYVVQGATYDHVYVNLRDILSVGPLSVKEKLQSLYTAVTRAKKTVTILV